MCRNSDWSLVRGVLPGFGSNRFRGGLILVERRPSRLFYRLCGEGPAIVMLHGMGGASASWRATEAALSSKFTVVCPDLPGFGDSPLGNKDSLPTVASMGQEVIGLLEELDLRPCVIVGTSMGGYVSLWIAINRPDLVSCLVLCHTSAHRAIAPELRERRLAALSAAGDMRSYAMATKGQSIGSAASADVADNIAELLARCDYDFYRKMLIGTSLDFDLRDQARRSDIPTLIIAGDEDKVIPLPMQEELHGLIARSQLVIFKGCGHISYMEMPDRFNSELVNFIFRSGGA